MPFCLFSSALGFDHISSAPGCFPWLAHPKRMRFHLKTGKPPKSQSEMTGANSTGAETATRQLFSATFGRQYSTRGRLDRSVFGGHGRGPIRGPAGWLGLRTTSPGAPFAMLTTHHSLVASFNYLCCVRGRARAAKAKATKLSGLTLNL